MGPWSILQPNLTGSKGFCPPRLIIEPPKKTVLQILPDLIVSPGLVSGATDTRHYEKISDNAYRFYPMRVNENNRTGFHGINENIGVENYKEIVQFTYQFIINQNYK